MLKVSSGEKFDKREWIHLIITLSIVQGIIWFASFVYANNSNALGYVSFAGTLISIILAVLAIGYTYGESQQQKNSSSTLTNQIEELVEIKDKLEVQAAAFENINELKEIINDFKKIVDGRFKETNQHVADVKFGLSSWAQRPKENGSNTQDSLTAETTDNMKLIKSILLIKLKDYNSMYPTIVICMLALYLDGTEKFDTYQGLNNYIYSYDFGNSDLIDKGLLVGGCITTCSFFIMIGLITGHNGLVQLDSGFVDLLKTCGDRLLNSNREGYDDAKLRELHVNLMKIKALN